MRNARPLGIVRERVENPSEAHHLSLAQRRVQTTDEIVMISGLHVGSRLL
jgi:hypothetical protein